MDGMLKLVRSFRFETALDMRVTIAERVLDGVEAKIQLFCASSIADSFAARDVAQHALMAIAKDLARFRGDTLPEFWAWCFQISRNKIRDHFRERAQIEDRFRPLPPDEIERLIDQAGGSGALSPADKVDFDDAIRLLRQAEPECLEYLWKHFVFGLGYQDIADDHALSYDGARMRVNRCLDAAQALVS